MIKILKQLQKQEITKKDKDGKTVTYHDYVCPTFKENEYLALTVNGKLSHPSNNKPYITRNLKSCLFNVFRYTKNIYAIVLVNVDNTALCTLLND